MKAFIMRWVDCPALFWSALLALTVIKSVLNSPSMWFFTLHFTLLPALVAGAIYLILAAVIPLIVLRLFHRGTVSWSGCGTS